MLNKQQISNRYQRRKQLNTRQQSYHIKYHRTNKNNTKEKRNQLSLSPSFDLKNYQSTNSISKSQKDLQKDYHHPIHKETQKDKQKTFGFLNQPNISLIAEKQEDSSFMSQKNGDGSLDSMDRMIIGVTDLELQPDEQKQDKYKQQKQQNKPQKQSNINVTNKSRSILQNQNKSQDQINYSRLRQQYQELIDKKRLFGDIQDELQQWSLPNQNQEIMIPQNVIEVNQQTTRIAIGINILNHQSFALNQNQNENTEFNQNSQEQFKIQDIRQKIQNQFSNFRQQASNLKSSQETLKLQHKIEQAFKQFRKLLNKKQNTYNSSTTSNLLNSVNVSLSFLQGHDQSNNSIRLLTGNLSQIHQQRQLHNGSQKDKSQQDRREIEQELRGLVDHGNQPNIMNNQEHNGEQQQEGQQLGQQQGQQLEQQEQLQQFIRKKQDQNSNILKNNNQQEYDDVQFPENPCVHILINKASKDNNNQDSIQVIKNLEKQLNKNQFERNDTNNSSQSPDYKKYQPKKLLQTQKQKQKQKYRYNSQNNNKNLKQNKKADLKNKEKQIKKIFKNTLINNSYSKIHFNQNNSLVNLNNTTSQIALDSSPTMKEPALVQSISKKSEEQQYQYILEELNDQEGTIKYFEKKEVNNSQSNDTLSKFMDIFQKRQQWINSQKNNKKSQKWKNKQFNLLKQFKQILINPYADLDQDSPQQYQNQFS